MQHSGKHDSVRFYDGEHTSDTFLKSILSVTRVFLGNKMIVDVHFAHGKFLNDSFGPLGAPEMNTRKVDLGIHGS